MTPFSQKYRTKLNYNNNKCGTKVFVLLRANCCTNCYYNFSPCGIFEKMMSFTPIFNRELEQGKLMAALNFFSNKGLKNALCNVRNSLKFSKISKKDLLCTKMQKKKWISRI